MLRINYWHIDFVVFWLILILDRSLCKNYLILAKSLFTGRHSTDVVLRFNQLSLQSIARTLVLVSYIYFYGSFRNHIRVIAVIKIYTILV